MKNMAVALIPARISSTRLCCKPLKLLGGIPLICRVYQAVLETELFKDIIVATDDEKIIDVVKKIGGTALMTSKECDNGTERIASIIDDVDCEVVVNVQGDEPFISKRELEPLLSVFNDEDVQIASLMTEFADSEEADNPHKVKVVVNKDNYALYFSRSKIPYDRDNLGKHTYYQHIGVYAFRKETLSIFPSLEKWGLEEVEKLEQLRWLENGYRIKMVKTDYDGFGIDTEEDLIKGEKILEKI